MLLTVCLLLAACTLFAPKFEKPSLSVVSVSLAGGNLLQQNFRVTLRIHNPNDRTLPIKAVNADLHVGGEPIASGSMDHPFTVAALGDTDVDVTVKANMALALLNLSQHADHRDQGIAYELSGEVALDLPFFRTMRFSQSGSLNNSQALRTSRRGVFSRFVLNMLKINSLLSSATIPDSAGLGRMIKYPWIS